MKFKIQLFLVLTLTIFGMTVPSQVKAQGFLVSGTVVEKATQLPVIGAGIVIKGTTTGAITDIDGKYSINAKEGDILECTFIGFKPVEVTVGKSSVIDFSMEEDTQLLEQSVVVGYGTLKKTQLVGAVENIDGEELENRINPDLTRSLQGAVAGLNIIQTDGKPTHSGSIYIRGNSTSYSTRSGASNATGKTYSIGTGSSALVLIDGVEGSLSDVNPDDIASVSVLKDASSTAVYGARGAFGVILVTTKKPSEEKINVNYSAAFSLNERIVKWEDGIESDGLTWAKSFVDFSLGKDRTPYSTGTYPSDIHRNIMAFSEEYLAELERHAANGYKNPVMANPDGTYTYYGNTNWVDMLYTDHHFSQTHNISINASGKRVSAYLSGKYYGQGNIYKVGKEDFDSFNLRSKVAVQITRWASIDNNTSLYKQTYTQPFANAGYPIIKLMADDFGCPLFVPENIDGSPTQAAVANGYWRFKNGKDYQSQETLNLVTTTGLDLTFIKDVLKFRGDFSYRAKRFHRDRVQTPSQYSTTVGTYSDFILQESSFKSRWRQNTDYWSTNAILTWTPKLGDNHDLNVVAGFNAENNTFNYFRVIRKGILAEDLPSFELMDGTDDTFDDYNTDYSVMGALARVNYTLMRRYIVQISARYDGSSKFPTGDQWAFFPSASLGWRISEEPWLKGAKSKWLDNLKLRANIGTSGNANVAAYRFIESIGVDKSSVLIGGKKVSYSTMPSVVPDNLTWENVTTYDIGLDFDIFKSRLSFSGDYYIRNNDNVIIDGPELPGIYGTSPPDGNYGKIQTKGWEAALSWRDEFNVAGKPFTYSVKASVWDSRTWVREYNNTTGNIFSFYSGKELGEIWGFRTDGIYLSNAEAINAVYNDFHKNGDVFRAYAGDLKMLDLNGDGVISYGNATLSDHGDLDRIGNTTPRYQFGINLDFNWNGIGLSLFFQGVGKRDWYPACESGFFWGQYNRPYSVLLKSQEGDNAVKIDYSTSNWVVTNADKDPYWTRQVAYAANRNNGPLTYENDHYMQNVAYVRLKNATLSWTLPKKWTDRIKMQKIRFYITGENLLTFSPLFKNTDMFDPEGIESGDSDFGGATNTGLDGVGNGFSYPMLRSYTFGFNISF